MAVDVSDPLFWVDRLSQRLMARQSKYTRNFNYAIGNHPVPNGDKRYARVLRELQQKAITNYVGLADKAVTEVMSPLGIRFGNSDELDPEAVDIWAANNMSLQSITAIKEACRLGDTYAMVSPPEEEGGFPVITIEDPRCCIVEPDPINPLRSLAGLKFYEDSILGVIIAVLYMPDFTYVYEGPAIRDFITRENSGQPSIVAEGPGAFTLVSVSPNPIGKVQLIRGNWQPEYGVMGMAECEDGGYEIQDRINLTVLHRLTISRSQAFRQRWVTGMRVPKTVNGKGGPKTSPFKPMDDEVWAVQDEKARFGDFEQADLRQLLEAVRDDVGDFAALTQTPVTYLTNKLINVSADTMAAAQVGLSGKIKSRKQSMGWFFEEIMKMCFRYMGSSKADEIIAETVWEDHEAHSMAEVSDMISKLLAAGIPMKPTLEYADIFSESQIELAVEEAEKAKLQEQEMAQKQLDVKAQAAQKPINNSSG